MSAPSAAMISAASVERARLAAQIEQAEADVEAAIERLVLLRVRDAAIRRVVPQATPRVNVLAVPPDVDLGKPIVDAVCKAHDVTLDDLVGEARHRYLIDARVDLTHRLRAAGWSLPRIGKLLRRDHSTIYHYCQKLAA